MGSRSMAGVCVMNLILTLGAVLLPAQTGAAPALPARVVNHEYLPPVGNQSYRPNPGPWGQGPFNCGRFNVSYYCMTWTMAKAHGWVKPNPATHPERVISPEWGEFLSYEYWARHGCATIADMADGMNAAGWPKRAQWEAALRNRITGYDAIAVTSADQLTALKARLAQGDIGLSGLMATPSFQDYGRTSEALPGVSGDVLYSYVGQNGVGHSVTLIGYDDAKAYVDGNGQARQGAFLAVNSWGTNWGVAVPEVGTRGFIWLAYEFFQATGEGATFLNYRPESTPSALAVISWNHPLSHQVVMQLMTGRPGAPDWSQQISFGKLNRPIDVELVIDISEPWAAGARHFWLRTQTADLINHGEPVMGSVTRLALELPVGSEPWECAGTPATTIPFGSLSDPQFMWLSVGLLDDEGPLEGLPALGEAQQTWGDFRGDGRAMGIVHGSRYHADQFTYHTHLLIPAADGGLTVRPSGLPEEEFTIAAGDLNQDGRLELLTYSHGDGKLRAWTLSLFNERFVELPLDLPAVNLGYGQMELTDFNNDGRLDLATYAWAGNEGDPIALRVWLRQPNGSFMDSGIRPSLGQISAWPCMAWGDVDGDGWVDVALTARVGDEDRVAILRNGAGSGLSTLALLESYWAGAFLTHDVPRGRMAFGHANGDGRPDLALSSCNALYINRGGGTFERVGLGEAYGSGRSFIGWGDLDNDGREDLFAFGDHGVVRDFRFDVWFNQGDESFISVGAPLAGLARGHIAPVDLDGDGDLDLVVAGTTEEIGGLSEYERTLRVVRNRAAQAAGLARANQPPAAPTTLKASVDGSGRLTLNWTAPADDRTPAGALRYALRLGSFPGWDDRVSAALTLDQPANRGQGRLGVATGALVSGLPTTALYASVQAIDSAGGRSAWSEPMLIAGAGTYDPCDINRDGRVDAVDLVIGQLLHQGAPAPAGAVGDVNHDGLISALDVRFVAHRLLGVPAPDRDLLAIQTIGPEGGMIYVEGMVLQIGAGQFATPSRVTVRRYDHERPEGDQSISPLFKLEGLPEDGLSSFTLQLRADRPFEDPPMLAFGMNGLGTSGGGEQRGSVHFRPVRVSGHWLTYEVSTTPVAPPPAPAPASAAEVAGLAGGAELQADPSNPTRYTWSNVEGWFGLASGKAMVESEHFQLVCPVEFDYVAITQLLDQLEAAYLRFSEELLFAYVAMPKTKIQVEVLDRGPDEFGSFLNLPGTAFDKLEFNTKDIVRDSPSVALTAWHEFAHCVHSQYFNSLSSASYWLDEATAVWAETVVAPGTLPAVYDENAAAPLKGLVAGGLRNAEAHGYGMTGLIKYLQLRPGEHPPLAASSRLWHRIQSGRPAVGAIQDVLGEEDFKWYTDFLERHIKGELFPYNYVDMDRDAGESRTIDLSKIDLDQPVSHQLTLPDLGGHLYQTLFSKSGLPADAVLSHRLAAPEHFDISGFHYAVAGATTLKGRGEAANGTIKYDLPLAGLVPDGNRRQRVLTLLTNREGNGARGYRGLSPYELQLAVTWDRSYPLPTAPAVYTGIYRGIPAFSVNGALAGRGLTGFSTMSLDNLDGQGNSAGVFATAMLIGQTPLELALEFNVTMTRSAATELVSQDDNETIERVYSVGGINYYRLDYFEDPVFGVKKSMSSPDGRFKIAVGPEMQFFSGTAVVGYDVTITPLVNGVAGTPSIESNCETTIGGLYLRF